jgi:hypothetical protein
MSRWITVEGDLEPVMECALRNKDSAPIDFTGATYQFLIKKAGAALLTRDTSTGVTLVSTTTTTARVRYAWQAGDGLEANKDIQARWVVTLSNGKKVSFPKGSTIAVIVNPQLS